MDDLLGCTLGGCVLVTIIGSGGLGTVFKGLHQASERKVAVKVLSPLMYNKPDIVARFEREARLCFQIEHPHIVKVYTWGEDCGYHYMAMEYISGATLEHLARHHMRLSWPLAAAIVADIADGLAHAHSLDIVHRDIKPSNMLVARGGRGKLADLGLARQMVDSLDFMGRRLTTKGAAIGSPAYMAPEQISDTASAGPAADVYGLGASLYHAIAGRPPLIGDTPLETLKRALRDVPTPIGDLVADVPDELSLLIEMCLDKDPEDRPPSAAVLSERLRDLVQGAGFRPGTWCP